MTLEDWVGSGEVVIRLDSMMWMCAKAQTDNPQVSTLNAYGNSARTQTFSHCSHLARHQRLVADICLVVLDLAFTCTTALAHSLRSYSHRVDVATELPSCGYLVVFAPATPSQPR
jgi:hypothetical protein